MVALFLSLTSMNIEDFRLARSVVFSAWLFVGRAVTSSRYRFGHWGSETARQSVLISRVVATSSSVGSSGC